MSNAGPQPEPVVIDAHQYVELDPVYLLPVLGRLVAGVVIDGVDVDGG